MLTFWLMRFTATTIQDFVDLFDSRICKFFGGYSGGATPDLISNSEVKSTSADGTARVPVWESRTPPEFVFSLYESRGFFFVFFNLSEFCLCNRYSTTSRGIFSDSHQ